MGAPGPHFNWQEFFVMQHTAEGVYRLVRQVGWCDTRATLRTSTVYEQASPHIPHQSNIGEPAQHFFA